MQFCPLKDLLRLARCNRTTLSAAANPVAWAGRPAVFVDFAELPVDFERSLIAKLPIVLHWQIAVTDEFLEWFQLNGWPYKAERRLSPLIASAQHFECVRSIPRLVQLHVTRRNCTRCNGSACRA